MSEEVGKPVGWLQFFFEDYLPESPCPPGCRHRHSRFTRSHGSVSSGSPNSSCNGETEEFFASASSALDTSDDIVSSYNKFSPIPIILDPVPRKISVPRSERSTASSRSPVGYPEDGYQEQLTASDEELKEIDDLISIYSERLSESESDRKSDHSSRKNSQNSQKSPIFSKKLPIQHQFSFSDSEIGYYTNSNHRPSQLADCVLSNCHCMNKGRRRLSINDVMNCSPLQRARKILCDAQTQCVFSDIVALDETYASPRLIRKRSPTDEDTLTKCKQNSDQCYSEESDHDTYDRDRPYYSDNEDYSDSPELPYSPTPMPFTLSNVNENNVPAKSGLHIELSGSSSGGVTTSTSYGTTASTNITTPSSNITTASSDMTTGSDGLTTVSQLHPISCSHQDDSRKLACFPPFVIDFFQFAAHPEDYLTDHQLDWYYEGEAKLMKRREERKRARNALIEETTRLEAVSNADGTAPEKRSIAPSGRELPNKVKPGYRQPAVLPDVELDVDIPHDLLDNPTVIRLAQQLQTSENHRKEVLVNCAKLENERSTLIYKVEDLKDLLEDQTELAAELKITLKAKCRDIERFKMQVLQRTKDADILTCQVKQREELLKEKAGIIITQLGDIMEVPLDAATPEDGVNDKYSIKKVEDIEKQNNQLKDEIYALREELQSRARNHVPNHSSSEANTISAAEQQELVNTKRQLEKDIEVYKARLTVEERDKIKLQGQISVLDSQVKRYRSQVQSSSEAEDEALREKRRLQKELRIKNEELKNSKDDYTILLKKLEKRPAANR